MLKWWEFYKVTRAKRERVFMDMVATEALKKIEGEVGGYLQPPSNSYKKVHFTTNLFSIVPTTSARYKSQVFEEIKSEHIRVQYAQTNVSKCDVKNAAIAFVRAEEIPKGKNFVLVVCDAAQVKELDKKPEKSGIPIWKIDVLILDENAEFMTDQDVKVEIIEGLNGNIQAELEAICIGLAFARKRKYLKVIVLSDCESVVDKLNLKGFPMKFLEQYVKVWEQSNSFVDCSAKFNQRELNIATNYVATIGQRLFKVPRMMREFKDIIQEDVKAERVGFRHQNDRNKEDVEKKKQS